LETKLNSLVSGWGKYQFFIVIAKRGAHGRVYVFLEISISGVKRVKDRNEVLPVRVNPFLRSSYCGLADWSIPIDMKVVIH
jgi:hypothetical protein